MYESWTGTNILNKAGSIRYAIVRHYFNNDAETHNPQFTYCRTENFDSLKTLLKTQGINLSVEKAQSGQIGQTQNTKEHDLIKPENSLNQQNRSGCRLVWFRTLNGWVIPVVSKPSKLMIPGSNPGDRTKSLLNFQTRMFLRKITFLP
jgi:hypothetical protein